GSGRAIAGTSTPYCRTLSAVSIMASSSLTLKGWFLKGCSSDSGISRTFSSLASWRLSSVENKSSDGASSTFFALLFKFYHLLGQIFVPLGHLAIGVMGKNALALGADFLGPDGMGNLAPEHLDFAAIGLPQQGGDLLGKVGAVVHHRQQYAVNLELGIDLPLHLVYGLEQLFQALGGQILCLDGDYDPVGGGQGVDREHTQGWLAVNQDMGDRKSTRLNSSHVSISYAVFCPEKRSCHDIDEP